jgi:prepilin-type N-terminal cleavage/methylation domain-containing protein
MKANQKGFSAIEIILVIVVVGLIATLGWVYFSKIQNTKDAGTDSSKQEANQTSQQNKCAGGSDSAENDTFCSEQIGVSVQVPDAFKGKILPIENYTVYTQNTINEEPKIFRVSDTAYEATIKGPNDQYSLTIAKEPLRNFRVKSYRPAFFNRDTKQITYENGTEVESVTLDGTKFYTYGGGDAGFMNTVYAAVIDSHLVVVSLTSAQQLGDPTTRHYILDVETLFTQFKERIKSLKVV